MYHLKKRDTWYGMLESSKGDTILIWDPVFPRAEKGKVLMYNTSRDKMVEYVEEILKPKLRDLSIDELQGAKSSFDGKLAEIKSEFIEEDEIDEEVVAQKPQAIEIDSDEISDDDLIMDDDDFEDI